MQEYYDEFKNIGYVEIKETSKYIEFKTNKHIPFERIKISKEDYSITKDCKSSQGNKGWRSISYKEHQLIDMIIKYWIYVLNAKYDEE